MDTLLNGLNSFFWVLVLIGAVLVVVILAGLSSLLDTILPEGPGSMRPVRALLASPLTILVIGVLAVAIAYRVLPPKPPRWRSILPAAILVGIAITILTQIFTFLVPFLVGAAVAFVGAVSALVLVRGRDFVSAAA